MLRFVHQLAPLLTVLAETFNAQKYEAGIDTSGEARVDQKQAQQREDTHSGLHAFDPKEVVQVLRRPLFHAYAHMISLVEVIPEKLAVEAETCICHKELLRGLSNYMRGKVLARHFKGKLTACPMAGKLAPELVCGSLLETFEAVWSLQANDLHLAETYGRSELSMKDREVNENVY